MEALSRSAGRRAAPEGPPAPGRHQGSLQARASPATGTRGQPGSPASAHPGLAIRGVLLAQPGQHGAERQTRHAQKDAGQK